MKKFVKGFAGLFLVLFAADGVLSFINDIACYFAPFDTFTSIRQTLAYTVMALTFPYVASLFYFKINRPFTYWLPVIYLITFSIVSSFNVVSLVNETSLFNLLALDLSPHWIYTQHTFYFVISTLCAFSQIVFAYFTLKAVWERRAENFETQFRYFKAFFLNTALVSTYLLIQAGMMLAMFKAGAQGFLTFNGSAVTSVEKIYTKAGKTIHLIPMIHVGSEKFYKDVSQIDVSKPTLILLEGVKDKKNLLQDFSYANEVLDTQKDHFAPKAIPQADTKIPKPKLSFVVADLDASEFDPQTRNFLNKTLKKMNDQSFFESIVGGEKIDSPAVMSNLVVDILERRNQRVLTELNKNQQKFDIFYIPWGAMHMPEIEREIQKQGFTLAETRPRAVFTLNDILQKKKGKSAKAPSPALSKILSNEKQN